MIEFIVYDQGLRDSVEDHRNYHKCVGNEEYCPELDVTHRFPNISVERVRFNSSVCNYKNDQPLHVDDSKAYEDTFVKISDLSEENTVAEPHLEEPNKHTNYPHVLLLAGIARNSSISVETHKESNDAHVVSQYHELEIMSYPLTGTFISDVLIVFS